MTVNAQDDIDRAANRLRLHQTVRDMAVLLLVAGIVALLAGGIRVVRSNALDGWSTTPGLITASGVETVAIPGRIIRYMPSAAVTYTYQVAGQTYTGHTISRETVPVEAGSAEAERLLTTYPAGQTVTVTYDPDDPADAVLETAVSAAGAFRSGLLLLGLALGAGVVALAIRPS